MELQPLPIDPVLPEIVARVRGSGAVVLEAPPGAGKTTRVPRALLDAGLAGDTGDVLVLEPRRLAARWAAARVAEELGERTGGRVGYQVRFESVGGRETRLWYVTEGVFTRRLVEDPRLLGVGAVVLDEFHERHIHTDVALAMVRRLRETERPDLRAVVMSATLDAAPVAEFLGAPAVRSEGRAFPVAIEHLEKADARPLHEQVVSAVRRLLREGPFGDVLVFLPGAAEIRRAREALEEVAAREDLVVTALHGELPAAEQDRALRPAPAGRRKVILSTNVAETSITVPGVAAVVDSGIHRAASHSPWSGLPTLNISAVSRASAAQRAGRAGRTRPGRCLRLYTRHDHDARPAFDTPEIRRADLAELLLSLAGAGAGDPAALAWLEAPPAAAVSAARALLVRLQALDAGGALTETGRAMLRYPVHPRQARLILEAAARGAHGDGCVLAALIGERDLVARAGSLEARRAAVSGPSDLLDRLDRFREAEAAGAGSPGSDGPRRAERVGLDPGAVAAVARASERLRRIAPPRAGARAQGEAAERALRVALLAAYPDRVAKRRRPGAPDLVLAEGGDARLDESSVVRDGEWLVAVDAAQRRAGAGGGPGTGRGPGAAGSVVRLASAIEPEWLLDLFPGEVRDVVDVEWNTDARRVDAFSRLSYGRCALTEERVAAAGRPEAARMLYEQARKAGVQAFADPETVERLAARLRFAAGLAPQAGLPLLDDAGVDRALEAACAGRVSLDELRDADLPGAFLRALGADQRRLLDRLAPEHVDLPGRRRAPVEYPPEPPPGAHVAPQPPYIASRIQDFFGLRETPRVGGGAIAVAVHLLAPNKRPVQITQDLAGFWERHYPAVRRELMRKYPRHKWPANPNEST